MSKRLSNREIGVVVLAAGKSTRMESRRNKILHHVAGRSLLSYVLEAVGTLKPERLVVVIGHQGEQVKKAFADWPKVQWVRQRRMRGTGDAVRTTEKVFEDFSGSVLVMNGDIPGIKSETLRRLAMVHASSDQAITVLTAEFEDPTGYGRIVPDREGRVHRIVEEKDATRREKEIQEINTGIAIYDAKFLFSSLKLVKPINQQKEYYLTDLVGIARSAGKNVGRLRAWEPTEVLGINTREELAELNRIFSENCITALMKSGVTFEDPASAVVEPEAEIGQDSVLEGQAQILGRSRIAADAFIGSGSKVRDSRLAARVRLEHNVYVEDATIGADTVIGPNTTIGRKGE